MARDNGSEALVVVNNSNCITQVLVRDTGTSDGSSDYSFSFSPVYSSGMQEEYNGTHLLGLDVVNQRTLYPSPIALLLLLLL